ncbi:MAG: anti-anti-sigma regulatory factor [Pirellulaceae bacterium]|jgi:anti-anti-sigma regulatory factor
MNSVTPFHVELVGDVTVVRLTNSDFKDTVINQQFCQSLLQHIEATNPTRLVVSMGQVEALTSDTITALLRARAKVLHLNGSMELCEVGSDVMAVLKLLDLPGKVFPVHSDEKNAVRSN